MKFVIHPADSSFDMLLEANQYRTIWKEHSAAIQRAFKDVTGLEFQQRHITASVRKGMYGHSGSPGVAMVLPGSHAITENKICTLMHELAHRLLGGNALGAIGLGLIPEGREPNPHYQSYEHRHIYLFLQDVIGEAFGLEYAERCAKEEQDTKSEVYLGAWQWAMSMSYNERQKAVRKLAAEALPRNRWHERDNMIIPARDAEEWFRELKGAVT